MTPPARGSVGYYVHHVGSGHRHRAQVLAERLAREGIRVTGLSSLEAPRGWPGDWVRLARDDGGRAPDRTAHDHLHWAPLHHDGLRERTSAISAWLASARPDLVVVDVSVEVSLLVRLHGVPVIGVVLPGRRDDEPHRLGLGVAEALVGFWPAEADGMAPGLPPELRERLVCVGALSRHPVRDVPDATPTGAARKVVLMLGTGGHDVAPASVRAALASTPGWEWDVLGAGPETWVDDPSVVLAAADVVVTHAGQNALAETAAARRPAVVLPQERPHQEQRTTAAVLEQDWPAVVCRTWPDADEWPYVLSRAASLDPQRWTAWCDGDAAERFARVVLDVRDRTRCRS
ncbi:hypothetical protein F4692_001909 [Nocardioides cavernae]|uniref:Glycosyl transferase family 28 C-terminal domain-containing protein n=1 Tax=Nocardioides cavernae TaxID=1921566 RepID=A0A7Y9KPJ1_9ACTN|nr:glycosyltransferase [Nocardioides cavernae]NYE36776.1 hypothetical protein [Nocardioides cavernae]